VFSFLLTFYLVYIKFTMASIKPCYGEYLPVLSGSA
jgi:hypothetical protein